MREAPGPDEQWVSAAVREHERALVAYAHRLTDDAEAARDIAQDTFLRLCRLPPDERRAVRPRVTAWLFTVCRNRAIDVRRRNRRTPPMTALDHASPTADDAGPGDAVETADTRRIIAGLIEGLPAKQQEVVRLRFQHDLTYEQIAEVTELSISYVGYLLHVALRSLREQLAAKTA
jgi:RNA polymerase sigma-70 factor (ECF subfamily)